MLKHRRWSALSGGDLAWLKAKHHFAITPGANPSHGPVGSLIVWNDDEIAPSTGFPMHAHKDIEIITYVRKGVLAHEDSLGSIGRIEAGDVQVMSAGTGIRHSEYNPGVEPLKIYQIWILPREKGGEPRWGAKPFPKVDRAGGFVVLASGMAGDDGALPIRANARVLGKTLSSGRSVRYDLDFSRSAYLVAAGGSVVVNGEGVGPLDGVAIMGESSVDIFAAEDAELVMVDAG